MQQHVPAKRAFLKGDFKSRAAMRPVGALPAGAFEEACVQCGDCARACPEAIIMRDRDGFPALDLNQGECTFCNACTEVCDAGALLADQPWNWRATLTDDCLSMNGISCRACEDLCEERAIGFQLQTGGRALPKIDADLCTGCGACAGTCPGSAVTFYQIQPHDGGTPC